MLKVSLVELCLRGFPEALLLVWSVNFINMKHLNKKTWILLSLILAIIIYFVKMLPIQYGIHTLIAVAILTSSSYYINKISLIKAISSSLIVITSLSICEFLNITTLIYGTLSRFSTS